jgi:uncharacterized protein YqfA (UPF0365 family)
MTLVYILVFLFLLFIVFYYLPIGIYMATKISGLNISLWDLTKYKHKKYPISELTNLSIRLSNNDINIKFSTIAESYKSNIDLENVVSGLIAAKQNNLSLTFDQACLADKQGVDIKLTVFNTKNNVAEEN